MNILQYSWKILGALCKNPFSLYINLIWSVQLMNCRLVFSGIAPAWLPWRHVKLLSFLRDFLTLTLQDTIEIMFFLSLFDVAVFCQMFHVATNVVSFPSSDLLPKRSKRIDNDANNPYTLIQSVIWSLKLIPEF